MLIGFGGVGCRALLVLAALVPLAGCSRGGGSSSGNRASPTSAEEKREGAQAVSPPPELAQTMPRTAGPTPPPPVVWLEPGDLLTSTGQTPIRAWLDNQGDPVPESLLAEVARELQLSAYPSLEPVSFDVLAQNVPPVTIATNIPEKGGSRAGVPQSNDRERPGERAYVELRPKNPLAESWYVLALNKIPSGVRVAPWSAPSPPIGAYAVRFHTGSHPVLVRAVFCEKSAGNFRSVVEFSENVSVTSGGVESVISVEQPASKTKCAYAGAGPVPSASMRWIDQDCYGASKSDPWRLIVRPGLGSSTGSAVTTFGGATSVDESIDVAALPHDDSGCKSVRF